MVEVYCNFGLHDDETGHECEVGDTLGELTYNNDGKDDVLHNIVIEDINNDFIMVALQDSRDVKRINVEDVVNFNY